tara:strand:- start:16882 stop:17475 length:594 start_codon:yes stop_codon:yes gene_type:complete
MSDHKGKLPVRGDGVYDALTNDEPNASGVIGSERSASIGVATSTQRVTAKAGDEDKIALDVALSDGDGNSINKDNPLYVTATEGVGTEIQDYKLDALIAKDGGFANHDYVTGSEFRGLEVECSSSALASFELQVETAVGSDTYSTIMKKFNSVANPNVTFSKKSPSVIASGITIRIIKTNLDNQATDLYTSINGVEV